jgi:hypothetical protein
MAGTTKAEAKRARAERLRAALKENLKRRKAQARARGPKAGTGHSAATRERNKT